MFCPRCGVQNRLEQKFCRNCGLSLPSVRLAALEGQIDEAKAELKRSSAYVESARAILVLFLVYTLGNAISLYTLGEAIFVESMGSGAGLYLFFGVVGLIFYGIFKEGLKRMERVLKTLEGKEEEQNARSAISSTDQLVSQAEPVSQAELSLPAVPDIDPILTPPAPGSIAEHTTFELKRPEPR